MKEITFYLNRGLNKRKTSVLKQVRMFGSMSDKKKRERWRGEGSAKASGINVT